MGWVREVRERGGKGPCEVFGLNKWKVGVSTEGRGARFGRGTRSCAWRVAQEMSEAPQGPCYAGVVHAGLQASVRKGRKAWAGGKESPGWRRHSRPRDQRRAVRQWAFVEGANRYFSNDTGGRRREDWSVREIPGRGPLGAGCRVSADPGRRPPASWQPPCPRPSCPVSAAVCAPLGHDLLSDHLLPIFPWLCPCPRVGCPDFFSGVDLEAIILATHLPLLCETPSPCVYFEGFCFGGLSTRNAGLEPTNLRSRVTCSPD